MNTRNPSKKTFNMAQLRGRWETELYKAELAKHAIELREKHGKFHGKDISTINIKRGKKVYIKNVDGLVQLSLA